MDVRVRSGEVKLFPFGVPPLVSITANQNSLPIYKESIWSTFQTILNSATFGLITATVNIQGSDDIWSGVGFAINNATLTNGSTTVTTTASQFAGGTEQLNDQFNPATAVGMLVFGPGIPVGTYVAAVTNNNSITLSAAVSGLPASPTVTSIRIFANNWCATALGTMTLSGTTSATAPSVTDGFASVAPWKFIRAAVTNITGTGATVQVVMGD